MASSFGAITLALEQLSALQVAAARCGFAAIALGCWSLLSSPAPGASTRALLPYSLVVGLLGYALPFALLAWAEQFLAPGHTAMLFCSGPVFAVLIAWLWQKDEKTTPWIFMGLGLCTLGIFLLFRHSGDPSQVPNPWAAGAVLACALCYALSGIWARKAPAPSDQLTRHSLSVATLVLLALCAGEHLAQANPPLTVQTPALLAALYLGLIPTALCSIIRYRQIQDLGYTFVSQTGYLVPTVGAALGFLAFSEEISAWQLLGMTLSLAGLAWSRRCLSHHSKNAAMRSSGRGGAD